MKSSAVFCFIILLGVGVFAVSSALLKVNPVYTLPGNEVKFSLTLQSTANVKKVVLDLSHAGHTQTLYNPSVHGNLYEWIYTTSGTPQDYLAKGVVTYSSTTVYSNVATFTTDIPALSAQSTIVYIPLITQSGKDWQITVKNVGSKTLSFTLSSTDLTFSPSTGYIEPSQTKKIEITESSALLPGKIHILKAFLNTNDPRKGMDHYLLMTIIEGPDGLMISPIEVSNDKVSVGSDVNFSFSVLKSGVDVTNVYVNWKTPDSYNSIYFNGNKDVFSSNFTLTKAGTYVLNTLDVSYVYQNYRRDMIIHPDIKVNAFPSEKQIALSLSSTNVEIEISSSSTPTLHVKDGGINILLDVSPASSKTWEGKYSFKRMSGPVDIWATFNDVKYAVTTRFERYILNSSAQNLSFNGGWINVPQGAFPSNTLVVTFGKLLKSLKYYHGYEKFNAISNMIEVVSDTSPSKLLTYHFNFNVALVNGSYNKIKVYKFEDGEWVPKDTSVSIQGSLARFQSGLGTYALGIAPTIKNSSAPRITYFTIIPRNSTGQDVQFFLSADKDCYYTLNIYDLRGRVVRTQRGRTIGNFSNIIYSLNPYELPNGMYVAVVGVGSSPFAMGSTTSESFVIAK